MMRCWSRPRRPKHRATRKRWQRRRRREAMASSVHATRCGTFLAQRQPSRTLRRVRSSRALRRPPRLVASRRRNFSRAIESRPSLMPSSPRLTRAAWFRSKTQPRALCLRRLICSSATRVRFASWPSTCCPLSTASSATPRTRLRWSRCSRKIRCECATTAKMFICCIHPMWYPCAAARLALDIRSHAFPKPLLAPCTTSPLPTPLPDTGHRAESRLARRQRARGAARSVRIDCARGTARSER